MKKIKKKTCNNFLLCYNKYRLYKKVFFINNIYIGDRDDENEKFKNLN